MTTATILDSNLFATTILASRVFILSSDLQLYDTLEQPFRSTSHLWRRRVAPGWNGLNVCLGKRGHCCPSVQDIE